MKVVTAAIVQNQGRYLIARRKAGEKLAGMWEFPGGKVEDGESLKECLKREMFEELHLDTEIGAVLTESYYTYEHGEILLVALEARLTSGDMKLEVHDRVEWLYPEELLKLDLAPADIPVARYLLEQSNAT
jgi:8-oxo-dGTP diphosphatase